MPDISFSPSISPSLSPSRSPSMSPSASPSVSPSISPSISRSVSRSVSPSSSVSPSVSPSMSPSGSPSLSPSRVSPASYSPSHSPSMSPSGSPSLSPSMSPSGSPSMSPSHSPSMSPSHSPSVSPSLSPSHSPSVSPSASPSVSPSLSPSVSPSAGTAVMKVSLGRRHIVIVPGGPGSTNFDITLVQSWNIPLNTVTGTFAVGDAVWQAGSLAGGTVFAFDKEHKTVTLVDMYGIFDTTNTVTSSSGGTGIPDTVHYAFPRGIRLSAISFRGAQNDILIVRDTNGIGKPIFDRKDTTGGGVHENVGGDSMRTKPYIPWSECTFGTPASAWIRLEFD